MKAVVAPVGKCPKCGQHKELAAGYCTTCLEIIQVAEEKRKSLQDWVVDLNKRKGKEPFQR